MLLNSEFENDVWPYLLYITVPVTLRIFFAALKGTTDES